MRSHSKHKTSLHQPALHKHRAPHFRLERWHRWSMYAVVAALTVSGTVWLIAHFFLRIANEFGESVHPWEHPAIQIHGALAMLSCMLIGSLFHLHMRRAHKAKRNRASGWSMISLMLSLIVSGYALYYLANENTHLIWSTMHWVLGLSLPVLLVLHIYLGRRTSTLL